MGYGHMYPYQRHKSSDSPVDFAHEEDIDVEESPTCLQRCLPSIVVCAVKTILLVWCLVVFAAASIILTSNCHATSFDYHRGLIVADDLTENIPRCKEADMFVSEEKRLTDIQSVKSEIKTFKIIPGYTIDPRNATDAEVEELKATWTKLMPAGRGFILANSSLDQLPHGVLDPESGEFEWSVAIFHQLHCLYAIMKDYNDGVRGLPTHPNHTRHCFEYLRISLMCYSDTTLEGRDPAAQGEGTDTTGMGAKHICKKFPEVFDWTYAHRRSGGLGIA